VTHAPTPLTLTQKEGFLKALFDAEQAAITANPPGDFLTINHDDTVAGNGWSA
jgi:hypothetical protein